MNGYFSRGRINTDMESDKAVHVNNCGYYKGLDAPIEIVRPNGRRDYHLLFCAKGTIEIGDECLQAGEAYLFYPRQKQAYTYLPDGDSVYRWVHFSGHVLPDLLETAGVVSGKYDCTSRAADMESLFRMLGGGLEAGTPASDVLASSLLVSILMLLPPTSLPATPFTSALRLLDDLSSDVTVSDLADMYKMSTGHFIRSFHSYVGMSPLRYRREKQITLAKMLLSDSKLPVTDIAIRVGLGDPLYFSRVFKKYVGISPSAYRRRQAEL